MQNTPGYYPLDDEFGYSVETHSWQLNGQSLTDEEAAPIYQQKMSERQTEQQREHRRVKQLKAHAYPLLLIVSLVATLLIAAAGR